MIGMEQVHGDRVVRVDKSDDGKTIEDCDALISSDQEVVLSVRVADCLPIFVVDKKSRSFGLIHAGWHGLEKKIIKNAVTKMIDEFSIKPADLEVSIGPHICQKHYEVKSDVSSKFEKYPGVIFKGGGKKCLDLAKVALIQLIESGVKKLNIIVDERCTFENKTLYSFRRNKTSKRSIYSFSFPN